MTGLAISNQRQSPRRRSCSDSRRRPLAFESLETRHLLAAFSVSNLDDAPVAAAGDAPGTLRQALFDANSNGEADTISFQEGLSGTLLLTAGELELIDSVEILGPGIEQLVINASGNDLISPGTPDGTGSRVFRIDDGNLNNAITVHISGLTLTGGDVAGDGGGIWSSEYLMLDAVKIDNNSSVGSNMRGGGVFSYGGDLKVDRSTISGNVVLGANANGGGIFSTTPLLGTQLTSIKNTTLSNNHASESGGGIFSGNNLSEDQTTSIVNSTISGNTSGTSGGGLFNFDGTVELRHTTVTDNTAPTGAGVASFGDVGTLTRVKSSIVSGNVGEDLGVFAGEENSFQSLGFNVVGTGNTFGGSSQHSALDNFNATGDQPNVLDPGLASLADNGGPTLTHALLHTSVALDAGDPAAQADVDEIPEFDQRQAAFGRVVDGDGNGIARIDVGAFELVSSSADFDADGDVDGTDFLTWQRGFGIVSGAIRENGDADGDGAVDEVDLEAWQSSYGASTAVFSLSGPMMAGDAGANSADIILSQLLNSAAFVPPTQIVLIREAKRFSFSLDTDGDPTIASSYSAIDSYLRTVTFTSYPTTLEPGVSYFETHEDGHHLEIVDELFRRLR